MNKMIRLITAIAILMAAIIIATIALGETEAIRDIQEKYDMEFTVMSDYHIWEMLNEKDDIRTSYGMESLKKEWISIQIDICYDDASFSKKSMNNFTEDELNKLIDTFQNKTSEPQIITTKGGQKFIAVRWKEEEKEILTYITVYESCMIEITAETNELADSGVIDKNDQEEIEEIVKGIRFRDTYKNLGNGWQLDKRLSIASADAGTEYIISMISSKENAEYIPICCIAENNEENKTLCLVKNNDTNELLVIYVNKDDESDYTKVNIK